MFVLVSELGQWSFLVRDSQIERRTGRASLDHFLSDECLYNVVCVLPRPMVLAFHRCIIQSAEAPARRLGALGQRGVGGRDGDALSVRPPENSGRRGRDRSTSKHLVRMDVEFECRNLITGCGCDLSARRG